jgi:hypothetical protein
MQALERLQREARAASALNHPNICTVHEVGEHEDVPFIVMEYIPGKSLDQLIGPEGLPVNKVLAYAVQVTGALIRAHCRSCPTDRRALDHTSIPSRSSQLTNTPSIPRPNFAKTPFLDHGPRPSRKGTGSAYGSSNAPCESRIPTTSNTALGMMVLMSYLTVRVAMLA